MAKTITVDLELKYQEAVKNLDEFQKEYDSLQTQVQKSNKETASSVKKIENATVGAASGVRKIGSALKATGIGLAIAAFAKFTEVLNQNQKVADFFNTTFETLSLAFNDFFNFIDSNIGNITAYFKAIFDDPSTAVKNLGQAIKENIIERFKSALEVIGFLGDAFKKLFAGDFQGAIQATKEAGKEFVDVLTGVDDTTTKVTDTVNKVVDATRNYISETVKAARANVELNKTAELNRVKNQIIIEQYDRQAEKLRQIRDDDTKGIEDRIAANEELGRVLAEQERLMLANVDAIIAAANAQYQKNKNQENEIALLEARAEREGVLARIEGLRSEQLSNINALERERQQAIEDSGTKEIDTVQKVEEIKKLTIEDGLKSAITLVGENSKFGKAIAIVQAIRDTYAGANKALGQGGLFGAVGAAAIVATGLANVKKIASTQEPRTPSYASSGSGGSTASIASAISTPPSFNVVGASGTSQLADVIAGATSKPMRAYVVASDVSTAQSLERNIVKGASL